MSLQQGDWDCAPLTDVFFDIDDGTFSVFTDDGIQTRKQRGLSAEDAREYLLEHGWQLDT